MFQTSTHLWFLGRFALYAQSLHAARAAYERVLDQGMDKAFGTVILDSGEEVDWVNVRKGVQEPLPRD